MLVELMEQRVATLEEELADLRSLIEALIGEYVGPYFEDHEDRLHQLEKWIYTLDTGIAELRRRHDEHIYGQAHG